MSKKAELTVEICSQTEAVSKFLASFVAVVLG